MTLQELLASFKSAVVLDPAEARKRLQEREDLARMGRALTRSPDPTAPIGLLKASGLTTDSIPGLAIPTTEADAQAVVEAAGLPWDPGYLTRFALWWASDERVDGMGDIVRQNWMLETYKKNPVLLMSHAWSDPPIGAGVVLAVEARHGTDYTGPALALLGVFATAETSPMADSIFRLVRARIMRAGSVGFHAHKIIDVKDEAERQKLGLGRWGYIFDDNELLEYSPTSVPANPGAVTVWAQAKQRGLLRAGDVGLIRELTRLAALEQQQPADTWVRDDAVLRSVARLLFPRVEFCAHTDIEQPVELEELREKAGAVAVMVTRGTDSERLVVIEEAIMGMAAALQEGLTGLAQIAEDTRTMLEEMHGMLEQIEATPAAAALDQDNSILAGAQDRLARLLERVDACSQV